MTIDKNGGRCGKASDIPIKIDTTGNDASEREGIMHLAMGAMTGMRNIYSHGDITIMPPMEAFERLRFVSLLLKRVDAALASATP